MISWSVLFDHTEVDVGEQMATVLFWSPHCLEATAIFIFLVTFSRKKNKNIFLPCLLFKRGWKQIVSLDISDNNKKNVQSINDILNIF